jgi:hypothetical protein
MCESNYKLGRHKTLLGGLEVRFYGMANFIAKGRSFPTGRLGVALFEQ